MLTKFINTDGVSFLSIMLHITPSVILIVIAEMVTNHSLYRVSDRKSLDFYRSY
jgi:hypothetical protein